jgi:hypothetical protein
MTLDEMIARAYSHFLQHRCHAEQQRPIFEQYAKEELNLSEEELFEFSIPNESDVEDEIVSDKFDHFYTWYYINYVITPANKLL